jgi:hypothetical protein
MRRSPMVHARTTGVHGSSLTRRDLLRRPTTERSRAESGTAAPLFLLVRSAKRSFGRPLRW